VTVMPCAGRRSLARRPRPAALSRRGFLQVGVLGGIGAGCLALPPAVRAAVAPATFNVRDYGATGNGTTLDTPAINKAIDAAAAAGGGTVLFPPGTYLSYTIRLKSHITLFLDTAATIVAANQPQAGAVGYDAFEPNPWGDLVYQDFGHSHWRNSLIWGDGLDDVGIRGPGRIWGRGLLRNGGTTPGQGNKTIALKACRNVALEDFTIFEGGWFALLATGVDNLTIRNLTVDTNRDGFDIDCCRNVRVSDCTVNSPSDDGICLKSSYGLGFARATDNVTITGCQVSGYAMGTLLDGTFQVPGNGGGTGRIKFGTESNGGFRNIAIANCLFVHCNVLAIESVDGAIIEDVTIDNIAMEHVSTAPVFIRLGARMRGPEGLPIGAIRRVSISNVVAAYASSRCASIISGIPGHLVEDVTLSRVRVLYYGGDGTGPRATAAGQSGGRGTGLAPAPPDPFGTIEAEVNYPEPTMFGTLPAYGLYLRHARRLTVEHTTLELMQADARPPIMAYDVEGLELEHVSVQAAAGTPALMLNHVTDLSTERFDGVPDMRRATVTEESISGSALPAPGSTYTPAAPAEHVPASANTPIPRPAAPGR
jgi:polygalacturonase